MLKQWWPRRAQSLGSGPGSNRAAAAVDRAPAPDHRSHLILQAMELRRLADQLETKAHQAPAPIAAARVPSNIDVDAAGSSPQPAPDLDVRVLGPLTAVVNGRGAADWRGCLARTLFGYLVVQRRPVHREMLMDLLWPGLGHGSARGNLNVCIYGARRALGGGSPGAIVYREGFYALNPELRWAVDLDRFVRLAERTRRAADEGRTSDVVAAGWRAAGEYGGPLLEGESNSDWCTAERLRLHELLMRVFETVGETCLALDDLEGAVQALERALREDPCRESAHRALMRCFSRRGQRDLVVRQFKRCTALLDDELEVTPSQETTRLFAELTAR